MDGEWIAEKASIEEGPGVWILNNCVVVEVESDYDLHAYEVYMDTDNGSISRQIVNPMDEKASDECRAALDRGESPVGAWEDGKGNTVCPDNGEIVEGGYSFEHFNGNNGDMEYFETAEEALDAAETAWSYLTDREKKAHIESTHGAIFNVCDPYGRGICDFIANARRAKDREEDADRASDDPAYLKDWFGAFNKRFGTEKADICIALFDGGWDGTESPISIMKEYDCTEDEANDTLDYLAMMTVEANMEPKDEWRGFKRVAASGTSLTIAVTDACRELGIQRGDYVEVIIKKA